MSQLRQDPVSGDWIIMAPERAGRPHHIDKEKKSRRPTPKNNCPFENPRQSGNWPPILSWPDRKNSDARRGRSPDRARRDWRILVIPNKYPALRHLEGCAQEMTYGPHHLKTGAGEHDLVVTRDHERNFPDLNFGEAVKVFEMLQERYRMLSRDDCNIYTSSFFNWGSGAGASLYHPHFQVLTLPIIPPDVEHSLRGSARYFKKHRRCVHCDMLKFDLKERKRVIEQNKYAVAVAPFVSRLPYEVRIFPKKHQPRFEKTKPADLGGIVKLLQSSLKRIRKYLNDPDFNFFIHTAPLKNHEYGYYHWHIEIIPKVSILGGFELSTGVEIDVVDPEKAAAVLRGKP